VSKEFYNLVADCQLPRTAKAIAKELAWFADPEGKNTYPSVDTLANRTGFTRRAIQKNLRKLQAMNVIHPEGSGKGGYKLSTHYWFDVRTLASLKRANGVHGLRLCTSEKGERHDIKRANGETEKGERGTPEQNEQEERTEDHHAFGAMPIELQERALKKPSGNATGNGTKAEAVRAWIELKERLRKEMPESEWNLWVKPARLERVMSGDCLLVALPPNRRIIEAARKHKELVHRISRELGYDLAGFKCYADDWEREELAKHYPDIAENMLGKAK
jgi:Helix-turn-helix domain